MGMMVIYYWHVHGDRDCGSYSIDSTQGQNNVLVFRNAEGQTG